MNTIILSIIVFWYGKILGFEVTKMPMFIVTPQRSASQLYPQFKEACVEEIKNGKATKDISAQYGIPYPTLAHTAKKYGNSSIF